MKKAKVLILSSIYPQGKGDHFIESELENLSENFEIDILPLHDLKVSLLFYKGYLQKFKLHKGLVSRLAPSKKILLLSFLTALLSPCFSFSVVISFLKELRLIFFTKNRNILKYIIKKILRKSNGQKIKYAALTKELLLTTGTIVYIFSRFKKRRIKIKDYDLIYSYWSNEAPLALSFWLKKTPLVSRFHGYDLYKERKRLGYFPHRTTFLKKTSLNLFISSAGESYLKNDYPILNKKNCLVNYIGSKKPETSSNYKPQKNELCVLSCSSLTPVKQVDFMIEALSNCDFKLKWIHIGDGPEEQRLTKLAEKSFGQKHSFQFKGFLKHDQIIKTFKEVKPDVFINSSKSEGLPITILESMSLGFPIIAPDIGGIKEAVHDHKNGFLISAKFTPAELTKACTKFYNLDTNEKIKFSEESLKIWKKSFDSDTCSKELVETFKALL